MSGISPAGKMSVKDIMSKLGNIIVLSGPSGVGKSTLITEVRKYISDLQFSVSCTTRKIRGEEVDHVHYHFLSVDEFEQKIARDEFAEYAKVFTNYYGTLKSEIIDRALTGKTVVLDIDVQGAMQIKKACLENDILRKTVSLIFIGPPSFAVLEQRLRSRATDSEEQINIRLNEARHELSFWHEYDYLVVNDNLPTAAAQLTALLQSLQLKTALLADNPF